MMKAVAGTASDLPDHRITALARSALMADGIWLAVLGDHVSAYALPRRPD